MEKMIVNGGRELCGEITPSGSKNAALPLIFASLALDGVSVLRGVPDISDVRVAIALLRSFGVIAEYADGVLTLDTRRVEYKKPDRALTSSIRASSYLIGASLARFGCFHVSEIGGCNFGNRPIDMHVSAACRLGATRTGNELRAERLHGAEINFEKRSVGATINALIMAATAEGTSLIRGAASEPHVRQLTDFLRSAGADIREGEEEIEIRGGSLHGGEITVIPDMIEAGTYLLIGALTRGRVCVKGCEHLGLESFFAPLVESGMSVIYNDNGVTLKGLPYDEMRIVTEPYPGYPTDLQPQIAPVMALGTGGLITETVWQSRFLYLASLAPFGVEHEVLGNSVRIRPSAIRPAHSFVTDLRGGAAALMCALAARGKSEIEKTEILARGYAELPKKLRTLGADIIEIKEN